MKLIIQSRLGAARMLQQPDHSVTHLVTISAADGPVDGAATVPHVLQLNFADLALPRRWGRFEPPSINDVEAAIEFGRTMTADDCLLVHCSRGISRSAAIALAIVADQIGPGGEREAMQLVRSVRGSARPNRLVVAYADTLLRRQGALARTL